MTTPKKMMICYNQEPPKKHPYASSREEYDYSLLQKNACYFNFNDHKFYNNLNQEINIEKQRILVRGGISTIKPIIQEIIKKGGIPVNTEEDIERIKLWCKEIKPHRKTLIVKGKDLLENSMVKERIVKLANNGEFFLKTKEKDFSGIVKIEELFDEFYGLIPALKLHLEDDFIVSEKVSILTDRYGNLEYRCFVIDGKIQNISRTLCLTYHKIPNTVVEAAQNLLEKIMKVEDFPNTFSLDIMYCNHIGTDIYLYDILELNPLEATGSYLYNDIYDNDFNENPQYDTNLLINGNDIFPRIPAYKKGMRLSYNNVEPQSILTQCYHKNGFSYHYACAKKFGKADFRRFKVHVFGTLRGVSIDIIEILNDTVSLYRNIPYIVQELREEGIDPNSEEFLNRVKMTDPYITDPKQRKLSHK